MADMPLVEAVGVSRRIPTALTTASTCWVVMSPVTTVSNGGPPVGERTPRGFRTGGAGTRFGHAGERSTHTRSVQTPVRNFP